MNRHLAVAREPLSSSDARRLTDEIKSDAERLWRRLLEAYEGGAHTALGFSSWGDYCKAEFGTDPSRGYQLLDAGKVIRAIETHSTVVERPRTEGVARPLRTVLRDRGEEAVGEVWETVVEEHGPDPTEEEVREVVGRTRRRSTTTRNSLTKEQNEFANALTSMELAAGLIASMLRTPTKSSAILDVPEDVREEWARQARIIGAASERLRRRFLR